MANETNFDKHFSNHFSVFLGSMFSTEFFLFSPYYWNDEYITFDREDIFFA